MQVSFQYSKPEVIDALRFHFLNRGEIRLFRGVLFVLLAFAAFSYWGGFVSFPVVVAIVLMLMLLVLAFWYILPFSIYKKAATFKEFIKLQYDEEGVVIGTHIGERRLSWGSFNNIVETRSFFYLYRDKKSFFLIPTNAFRSDSDRQDFSDLLKSKFGNYIRK